MVYDAGLESRFTFTGIVGSNPTSAARMKKNLITPRNMLKYLLIASIILVSVLVFWQSKTVLNQKKNNILSNQERQGAMKISSLVFKNNSPIPAQYTCDGQNINPPLEVSDVPPETTSLALIVDDPDAPGGTFLHWLVWDIDPNNSKIEENSLPNGAVEGKTSFGKIGYGGPCPPSGEHHYFFKIYALDVKMGLATGSNLRDVKKALEGHILATSDLIGKYQRH